MYLFKKHYSTVERLEDIRNIKFKRRIKKSSHKTVTVHDIVEICGGRENGIKCLNDVVSFVGFFNEFDFIFGKNCVYVHLVDTEDTEWHVEKAMNHGALAIIAERQIQGFPCIIVENVWDALVKISRWYYQGLQANTTVIAGSIGKTTTKEMVECVYQRRFRTLCTPNNGNVLAYLAYEIQHMPPKTEQFIQEVDESYPNNADYCSYVLHPEIAIITAIDKSHIGTIGGEKAVEKAILDVTNYVPESGTVILNQDDPKSSQASFRQNTLRVSIKDDSADCYASDIVCMDDCVDFNVYFHDEIIPIHLNCPGEHNVYNAMFAFLAGKLNGLENDLIQKGLSDYHPMKFRQRTYHSRGKTVYVDCYNASARSVSVALSVLKHMQPTDHGRRIAVIGDIAEIEGYEKNTYSNIAESIRDANLDFLITYGTDCESIWDFLGNNTLGQHLTEEKALVSFLKKELHRGDVILLKASHSMHLDRVVVKAFPSAYYRGNINYWIKLGKWIVATI